MRIAWVITVFLLASLPSLADDKASSDRIAKLITQLGSGNFVDREDACKNLQAIGAPALQALEQALKNGDAEVRRRAEESIGTIQKRLATAKLLAPKRIHLKIADKPVKEALDEFAKQTGFRIQIDDYKDKPAGVKITLDLPNTTFWEAFDQLCQRAELRERSLQSGSNARQLSAQEMENRIIQQRVRLSRSVDGAIFYDDPKNRLNLINGKPPILPTYYAGALRIRALPPNTPLPGHGKGESENLLALDVTPEPSIDWQQLIGMRVDKALDEHGQLLKQPATYVSRIAPIDPLYGRSLIDLDTDHIASMSNPWLVPVHLKSGEKPAKLLKELHGTIAGRVLAPREAVITIDKIVDAGGKTFKGPDGTSLKVIEAKRLANGVFMLRLQTGAQQWNPNGWPPNMVIIKRGGALRAVETAGTFNEGADFGLQDAKGKTLQPYSTGSNMTMAADNVLTQEYHMYYRGGKDDPPPAKFTYTTRRSAIVEVPFVLKDVPLK